MVKIFKNHFSLYAVTTAMIFFVHNVNATGSVKPTVKNGISCSEGSNGKSASSYKCNDGKGKTISGQSYQKAKGVSETIAIEVSKENTVLRGENITVNSANNGTEIWETGAKVSEGGKIFLTKSTLKDVLTGVDVVHGRVKIEGGAVDARKVGVSAHVENGVSGNSYVSLVNTNIKTSDKGVGLFSHVIKTNNNTSNPTSSRTNNDTESATENGANKSNVLNSNSVRKRGATIDMNGGEIDFTNGVGVEIEGAGRITLQAVSIKGKGHQVENTEKLNENSAFHIVKDDGFMFFSKGKVDVVNTHGILLQARHSYVQISESNVSVKGGETFYGMRFLKDLEENDVPTVTGNYTVYLDKTSFIVPNSTAVYSSKFYSSVELTKGTELSGDLLLRADDKASLEIFADNSILSGGARVDESSITLLKLMNNSKWTLTRPQYQKVQSSDSIGLSSVSRVHISDSSIIFKKPEVDVINSYQTLCVGEGAKVIYSPVGKTRILVGGEGAVYSTEGNAHLHLNTYLNKGGALQDQKTDRLLVHGDVEGQTIVHVHVVPGSLGGGTGSGGNNHGISVIQVSGKAKEDSFKLDGDYIALDNLPYQYRLYAYGPESHLGKAHAGQRLVKGDGEYWDFRLENRYVDPTPKVETGLKLFSGSNTNLHLESSVRSVVPQVPTYLLLPNSIFHAGLMDINSQNKQLEIQRSSSSDGLKNRQNPALYLRGYGGSYRYHSNLSALEYGYGGDLGYNGLEAGILLQKIENADIAVSFGMMGSYGKLSLQPLDVEQSQKSAFDKWTGTAYGSMHHEAGFYVDGLVSYGAFKGDVLTLAQGKTATLQGNPLSVSLTGGQTFVTGYEGFVFDPQAQVVYQHLQFKQSHDVDGFDIDMGKLDQWIARVGGRLTKTVSGSEEVNTVSFYGKLYLTHGFGGEQSVRFKDAFQLGSFGSSLEAGLGFEAKLSQKFSLQGNLAYQHKLTKAGFSGISFSGGLHYHF